MRLLRLTRRAPREITTDQNALSKMRDFGPLVRFMISDKIERAWTRHQWGSIRIARSVLPYVYIFTHSNGSVPDVESPGCLNGLFNGA